MKKEYDYITFILRAAPFHNGHLAVLRQAQAMADNVIVLVGSSNRPRTIRNPWTFPERCYMILNALPTEEWMNVHVTPLNDYYYDEGAWVDEIWEKATQIIRTCELQREGTRSRHIDELKLGIIGYQKDKTSGYLTMFEEMEPIIADLITSADGSRIDATTIRNDLFEHGAAFNISSVPDSTLDFVMKFTDTPEFAELKEEYNCIKRSKEQWATAPYTPIFAAGDAIVMQNGCVLMITRKKHPGKDRLAIPGGFIDSSEFWECTAYRELYEETGIEVPLSVLKRRTVASHVFDHPLRDQRGRMLTNAVFIVLPNGDLPKVTGMDDASSADWIPLHALSPTNCFADHWDIIRYFLLSSDKYRGVFTNLPGNIS